MDKKIIILSVAIIVILVAIVVIFMNTSNGPKMGIAPTPETPATSTEQARPAAAPFETEKIKEKYYTLELEYPKNSATERSEIGEYIEKVRSDFLSAVPKTDEEAEYQGVGGDRLYTLEGGTTVYTSSSTITYLIETSMYTGGNHGITIDIAFNYDREGKLLELKDILSSSDSLSKLSAASRTYFSKKLGNQITKQELEAGTEPKEENFSTWYVTDSGITFIFQHYQIGPYVIGIQEFPLTRTQASAFLKI